MPAILKIANNQRVDREDFEFTSETPLEFARQIGDVFLMPADVPQAIISGFTMDEPVVGQFRVTQGTAFLSYRDKGQLKHGAISSEGDAEKIIDVSSLANDTYGVWIRFELTDSAFQNKIFWNAATTSEITQSVATRRVVNWNVKLSVAAPTSEWVKIGEVPIASGNAGTIVDQRPLYFENAPSAAYARTWGGGDDRNADRATYGVMDLRTMLDALTKKVEELQSGTNAEAGTQRWWVAPVNSLDDMFPLSGSIGDPTRVRGNFEPLDSVTHSVGSASLRWLNVHAANILATELVAVGTADIGTTGTRWSSGYFGTLHLSQIQDWGLLNIGDTGEAAEARVTMPFWEATNARTLAHEWYSDTGGTTDKMRHYAGANSQLQWTANAQWQSGTAQYQADDSGVKSAIMALDLKSNVFRIEGRAAGAGTWADTEAGWNAASLRFSTTTGELNISGILKSPGVTLETGGSTLAAAWNGLALTLNPSNITAPDIGNTTDYIADVFAQGVRFSGLPDDEFTFTGQSIQLDRDALANPHIAPTDNDQWSLGLGNARFKNVFSVLGNFGPASAAVTASLAADANTGGAALGLQCATGEVPIALVGTAGTAAADPYRTDGSGTGSSIRVTINGTSVYIRTYTTV